MIRAELNAAPDADSRRRAAAAHDAGRSGRRSTACAICSASCRKVDRCRDGVRLVCEARAGTAPGGRAAELAAMSASAPCCCARCPATTRRSRISTAWPRQFQAHPRFDCTTINLARPHAGGTRRATLARIYAWRGDVIVILHSVFSNALLIGSALRSGAASCRSPRCFSSATNTS